MRNKILFLYQCLIESSSIHERISKVVTHEKVLQQHRLVDGVSIVLHFLHFSIHVRDDILLGVDALQEELHQVVTLHTLRVDAVITVRVGLVHIELTNALWRFGDLNSEG